MTEDQIEAIRAEAVARGLRDPLKAYRTQRAGAKSRGLEFRLTFAEWWSIWEPYYHLRGPGNNGLCMAREGDEGAYEVGNVYLTTNLGNRRDYCKSARAAKASQQTAERNARAYARRQGSKPVRHLEDAPKSGIVSAVWSGEIAAPTV